MKQIKSVIGTAFKAGGSALALVLVLSPIQAQTNTSQDSNGIASTTATVDAKNGKIHTATTVNLENAIKDGVENTPPEQQKSFFGAIKTRFQQDKQNGKLPGQDISVNSTPTGFSLSKGDLNNGSALAKNDGSIGGLQHGLPMAAWTGNGDTVMTPQGQQPTITGQYLVVREGLFPINEGTVGPDFKGRPIYPYTGGTWVGGDNIKSAIGVIRGRVCLGQYVATPSGYLPVINHQVHIIRDGNIQYNLIYTGEIMDDVRRIIDDNGPFSSEVLANQISQQNAQAAAKTAAGSSDRAARRAEAQKHLDEARAKAAALAAAANEQANAARNAAPP